MARFRKKPVVIDAVQFTGDVGAPEIMALDVGCSHDPILEADVLHITTLEGVMTAIPGDWIVTGVKGERYPCKPDIFEATYEEVYDDNFESGYDK